MVAIVRSFRVPRVLGLIAMGTALIGLFGCGGSGARTSSPYDLSIKQMKVLALGLITYGNDNDDVIPPKDKWMDGLLPYVHDATLFHSPSAPRNGYGYALNSALAEKNFSGFANPDTVPTLFDSTDLRRNATDPISTQPSPPRYGSKNTIAYLDGHVQDELGTHPSLQDFYAQSQVRAKRLGVGMLIYSGDYDDVFPQSGQWVDELLPYIKTTTTFRSPIVQYHNPSDYGYAMNADIAGIPAAGISNPQLVFSIFDSTDLARNATDSVKTLPNPPRYGTDNTISFLDGHVRSK